jgi:hypothetical protein
MVCVEHITTSASIVSDKKDRVHFSFQWVSPIWYFLIITGLSLTALVAFSDLNKHREPQLIEIFFSMFIGRQLLMQLIFCSALLAHAMEAFAVVVLCPSEVSFSVRLAWILQTLLLGYPSLKPFLIQRSKAMRKKQK